MTAQSYLNVPQHNFDYFFINNLILNSDMWAKWLSVIERKFTCKILEIYLLESPKSPLLFVCYSLFIFCEEPVGNTDTCQISGGGNQDCINKIKCVYVAVFLDMIIQGWLSAIALLPFTFSQLSKSIIQQVSSASLRQALGTSHYQSEWCCMSHVKGASITAALFKPPQ